MISQKKLTTLLGFLGLYLISAGISWAVFSGGTINDDNGLSLAGLARERSRITDDLPRTEVCPINGDKFTTIEREIWEERRPLAVIIENNLEARPLSGLSRADVVYEAVAEGGITRHLAIFYCAAAAEEFEAAVVRSARVYYIKWAAEYGTDPIFIHWGGANNFCSSCPGGVKPKGDIATEANAYALMQELGWYAAGGNDFDGGISMGLPVLKRKPNRLSTAVAAAAEHQPVVVIDEAYKEAAERGFDSQGWKDTFTPWKFKDGNPAANSDASTISFGFWSNKSDYDVTWKYNTATNSYFRENGGKPDVDWEFDSKQIEAKNVIIQFLKERGPVDRELHMYYENVGSGDAMIFQNGTVIEGTWEKEQITGRTKYFDTTGGEIEIVRGPVWVEGVPAGNKIEYN